MKTKIYNTLNKPYIVVFIMLIAPLLGFIDRNFVYFFGIGIAFFIFWRSKFDRSKFGLDTKLNWNTLYKSLKYTFILFIADYIIIGPILYSIFGETDLSSFNDIKGSFPSYLILMLMMWVFAAFGEEFLNRGFYMKWLAKFLGDTKKSWLFASIITSIYFALGHIYQGISGATSVFFWSVMISAIFMKHRKNLWLPILIHGFFDTIGITLLYFDKIGVITKWVSQIYQ
ncbi:MAG: CPBP family intramembrane metalloprotease [Winogradskyella sp.]|uniref:CPBP family intramembrane glutamic endopeptidase n=1 Tax=Winogradskyella sp. TaxID=1883156 RepID=UPI0025FC773A|nr:type II CAAX endopeptidase family protein [Winogradskyella sp.]NRB61400.1 CPBP family intramembrane metalloprotease [Winogradskyella sp.]